MAETKETKNKPHFKVTRGNVAATVWKNEGESKGEKYTSYSIKLSKFYKDDKGEWQNTDQFSPRELQYLRLALTDVENEVVSKKEESN